MREKEVEQKLVKAVKARVVFALSGCHRDLMECQTG